MTKFNVGDKVRFTGPIEATNFTADKDYAITKLDGVGFRINDDEGDDVYIARYEFKYVKKVSGERTKNQRITALENELAELKLIVHELCSHQGIDFLPLTEPSTINDVEDKPLSPNQQRAQIIEDAKKFVEDCKDFTGTITGRKGYRAGKFKKVCDAEFVVKPEKRTVVCILKEQIYETIEAKGIAKCNPSDVFNKWIGMAIALGRALNLDVTKFEQAVQPNKPVIGMKFIDRHGDVREIVKEGICDKESMKSTIDSPNVEDYPIQIINDTNAQYGGVE